MTVKKAGLCVALKFIETNITEESKAGASGFTIAAATVSGRKGTSEFDIFNKHDSVKTEQTKKERGQQRRGWGLVFGHAPFPLPRRLLSQSCARATDQLGAPHRPCHRVTSAACLSVCLRGADAEQTEAAEERREASRGGLTSTGIDTLCFSQ